MKKMKKKEFDKHVIFENLLSDKFFYLIGYLFLNAIIYAKKPCKSFVPLI